MELDSEPNDLWNKVENLLADSDKLGSMAVAAKGLGMPDAADRIAKEILLKEGCDFFADDSQKSELTVRVSISKEDV